MKKNIIISAVIAAALSGGFVSCGGGASADKASDTVLSQEVCDSMSMYYGQLMGAFFNNSIADSRTFDTINVDKKEFIKGLQMVLGHEYSEDMISGMMAGIQIRADLNRFKTQGLDLNSKTIMRLIAKGILADSVGQDKADQYKREFDKYFEVVNKRQEAINEQRAANSPQGMANNNAGKAAVAKFKAANPQATETSSGIVALIETKGQAPVSETNPMMVDMTMYHVDGTQVNSISATPVMLNAQPEGIREAITMLGAGGKGRFYLPPTLVFGATGLPEFGIGPMEWIILDINVRGEIIPGGTTESATESSARPL